MEWYIILDLDSKTSDYLVMADYHTLRDDEGFCWKNEFNFTKITPSDITIADYLSRNRGIEILHKFVSNDPLTYVNNLQFTHPELFI